MSKKGTCTLVPEVNGKESKLYKDLLTVKKIPRPVVNYLYVMYLTSNVADLMDAAGFQRDSRGQHRAEDYCRQINYDQWATQVTELNSIALSVGAIEPTGAPKDYTNAKEALDIANNVNNNYTGIVATVVKHGDVYHIQLFEKDIHSHMQKVDVASKLQIWDEYKNFFNTKGIMLEDTNPDPAQRQDIVTRHPDLASRFNAFSTDIANQLKQLSNAPTKYLYYNDILTLLALNSSDPTVQRLLGAGMFSSIEDAARALDTDNRRSKYTPSALTAHQRVMLERAVDSGKNLFGRWNLDDLQTRVQGIASTVTSSSPEESIRATFQQINQQCGIDLNEMHRTSREIKAWSDAAKDAVFVLKREIEKLKFESSNTPNLVQQRRNLNSILNKLMKELASKQYYSGLLDFLGNASSQINSIETILNQAQQTTGDDLHVGIEIAKALRQIKAISDRYFIIISALASDKTTIDESVSQVDIDNVRNAAKQLLEQFERNEERRSALEKQAMEKMLLGIVGTSAPDGQTIDNLLKMAAADATLYDWLYSVGEQSNPILAAMGYIIRRAQDSRDAVLDEFSLRIRRATDTLYKTDRNTEFMYEKNGYIISDIDWDAFHKAEKRYLKGLLAQGVKGLDLQEKMDIWREQNTEERVVNTKDGRTERVPNTLYRKQFPTLTPAQQKYYDTMMQIKGEIGSLFPNYAQNHYLAPQIRRDMLDAMTEANREFKKGNVQSAAKAYLKAIKNKAQNYVTVREDDTEFAHNGIIDGTEFTYTKGDFADNPLRQIPIFFVNRVEKGELLKDFSSGIQALAGTAVNYQAMDQIRDAVEFIGDFAKQQDAREDKLEAEEAAWYKLRLVKDLFKRTTNVNTTSLVEGFINQHLFGERTNTKQRGYKYAKLIQSLIGYTSFKGLATNVLGAINNFIVGEWQMFVEAGAGEFYGFKNFKWAHKKLFSATGGVIAELLSNNIKHKSVLISKMFDPQKENFESTSRTRYHSSIFRRMLDVDCSFIGYSSGEFMLHQVNMYSILDATKVKLNGRTINLYDAFDTTGEVEGNVELVLRQGVTTLDGEPITPEFIENVRTRIRYVNKTCHGAMNQEDKGIIHQYLWGKAIMNFRQWMVEHYSRRFRARHFDSDLKTDREGYYVSFWNYLLNEDTKEAWNDKLHKKAITMFMKDLLYFTVRAETQWQNLTPEQRANVNRVHTETLMALLLGIFSFSLGDPDKHKKEFWRRFFMYQTRRLMFDYYSATPIGIAPSAITLLKSPMASINTFNSFLYIFYGLSDLGERLKSGPHKGEIKYFRNLKKYTLPLFKDIERLQTLDTNDNLFSVFDLVQTKAL